MNSSIARYIFLFIALVLFQGLVLNNVEISGIVNPYVYILFLLLLPLETSIPALMFWGFVLGLCIDMFTNTLGMHAATAVLVAYLRPLVIKSLASSEVYDKGAPPSISTYGFNWFLKYTLILAFAHHLVFFFLEVLSFNNVLATLLRVLVSTLVSVLLMILSQLFYLKKTE